MRSRLRLVPAVVALIAIAAMFTGCGSSGAPSTGDLSKMETLFVTGVDGSVALRAEADESSDALAQLSNGTEVKLMDSDSDNFEHVYCEKDQKEGYIKSNFVTNEEAAVCRGDIYYTKKKTTLYKDSTEDSSIVQSLAKGTKLSVIAKLSGNYWRVRIPDTDLFGYVKIDNISANKVKSSGSGSKSNKNSGNQEDLLMGKGTKPTNYDLFYARVDSGFLALRNEQSSSDSNIIGKLYTGDSIYVVTATGTYWYCYAPTLGMYGYINSGYMVPYSMNNTKVNDTYIVHVDSGYLALRNEQSSSDSNIIGKLYSGETVEVYDYSGTYWYVYAPSNGYYGYVNSNYLHK